MEEERKKTETEVEVEYIQVYLPPLPPPTLYDENARYSWAQLWEGFSLDATADKIW